MTQSPLFARSLPDCRCPGDCGGRPEAALRLTSPYPTRTPAAGDRPPADCYTPTRVGELVHDALNGRPGVFMERIGPLVYLRPERGGVEWAVDARWIEAAR